MSVNKLAYWENLKKKTGEDKEMHRTTRDQQRDLNSSHGGRAHLDGVFLSRQHVHDVDFSWFFRPAADIIRLIFPPRLSKVGGPVSARARGRDVHKTTQRCVRQI